MIKYYNLCKSHLQQVFCTLKFRGSEPSSISVRLTSLNSSASKSMRQAALGKQMVQNACWWQTWTDLFVLWEFIAVYVKKSETCQSLLCAAKKKKTKTDTHLTQGRWSKVKHLGWLWWERHFVYSVVDNVSLLFMQAFGYVWLGENCDLTWLWRMQH